MRMTPTAHACTYAYAGEVWKAVYKDLYAVSTINGLPDTRSDAETEYSVAAKISSLTGAQAAEGRTELNKEAAIMAMAGYHKNLVSLIGVITVGTPYVIIVSYCEHGDINGWLRKKAADGTSISEARKLKMCSEIANGMDHLGTRRIIHRDLAARNVLLTSKEVCKVADFGLSRVRGAGEYYYRAETSGPIPVKWTASEALPKEGQSGKYGAYARDACPFVLKMVYRGRKGLGVNDPRSKWCVPVLSHPSVA